VIAIYSQPPIDLSNEAVVNLGVQISEIPSGRAIQFAAPAGTTFEMADGGGNNRAGDSAAFGWFVHSSHDSLALAANSSHLGCSVSLNAAAAGFQDPCGGSLFALDGAVLHGPAMFPLSHLSWRQVGPSTIGDTAPSWIPDSEVMGVAGIFAWVLLASVFTLRSTTLGP
jgi:hypothetical protein